MPASPSWPERRGAAVSCCGWQPTHLQYLNRSRRLTKFHVFREFSSFVRQGHYGVRVRLLNPVRLTPQPLDAGATFLSGQVEALALAVVDLHRAEQKYQFCSKGHPELGTLR